MTEQTPTRLADYAPPPFLVEHVELTFRLDPRETEVTALLRIRPNPVAAPNQDLWLDGRAVELVSAQIDGRDLAPGSYALSEDGLRIAAADLPAGAFDWHCVSRIAPAENTALEGLYMSRGMFCTQCEAEGFRKITFFPDRPDVMSVYTVRIEGDAPVLLSNGNPVENGPGFAVWHDPWPKPAYLFALVAGDLHAVRDSFTTMSGREVALAIWVRAGDEDRCAYALDALKRSMRWDETEYGREYDLDVFNIVAVDDFNMGAMENKGLNIFNSKFVLASVDTATDADYASIEAIIAHEYFHNWTGNRVTCRDWFQLSLKEGLTVYRDQQFSADERSAAVKRISDVRRLRAMQFAEDAGPLAHPVRPSHYVEINNFYTATVYEKGAEVIGMLRRLVGVDTYRRALDLFFERHDGQACTVEDWLAVFEEASGQNLDQFKRWYAQAGTPLLEVLENWDGEVYRLKFRQSLPHREKESSTPPLVIPIAYGLLGADGSELAATDVFLLSETETELSFHLPERPVASILREFSAPVILKFDVPAAAQRHLARYDSDPFNQWEAGQQLARDAIFARCSAHENADLDWIEPVADIVLNQSLHPAFRALISSLPEEDGLAAAFAALGTPPDPLAIFEHRRSLHSALAHRLAPDLHDLRVSLIETASYQPNAEQSGRRALDALAIWLISLTETTSDTARGAYRAAENMTDTLAALTALVATGQGEDELVEFGTRWAKDRLVLDKWFALQVVHALPQAACQTVARLTQHPEFDWRNPNRFRSLIGAFTRNSAALHATDGSGYRLVAEWILRMDPVNPQIAARLLGVFETWHRYGQDRQEAIMSTLAQIDGFEGLSRNSREIVRRLLPA